MLFSAPSDEGAGTRSVSEGVNLFYLLHTQHYSCLPLDPHPNKQACRGPRLEGVSKADG